MAPRFLERNKRKGLLGLLLLLLREQRTLALLLLVVVMASTVIVTPSSFLMGMPGGARLTAGVAWLAQTAGVDAARLGLGPKRSFTELVAALRAAKEAGSAPSIGWGPLFSRASARPGDSLQMISGSRKDLERLPATVAGKAATIKGIMTQEESKASPEGKAVAVSEEDLAALGGEPGEEEEDRERLVAAGGYVNSSVRAAMASVGNVRMPRTSIAGSGGRMSSERARQVKTRLLTGTAAARSSGEKGALTQLADGRSRAVFASDCLDHGCPGEMAATNSGANYDGNPTGQGILKGEIDTPPTIMSGRDVGGEAKKLLECGEKMKKCQQAMAEPQKRLGQLTEQVGGLAGQMGGACGDPCNCGPCNNIKNQIRGICGGEMREVMSKLAAPCDPSLPEYCESQGIGAATYGVEASRDLCAMDMGRCGCDGWACNVRCWFRRRR